MHRPVEPKKLDEQREIYGLLGDLFILLTGSELILDWPRVSVDANGNEYVWYFWRDNPTTKPIKLHVCRTNFPELQQDLGSIWRKWKTLRNQIGPGAYLYRHTAWDEAVSRT